MEVSGVRFQVSGVGKAMTTKNYMDVEDRGQNLEVGGRKSEVRRKTTDDGRQRTELRISKLQHRGLYYLNDLTNSLIFHLTIAASCALPPAS